MYSDLRVNFTGTLITEPRLKPVGANRVCSFVVSVNTGKKNEEGFFETNELNCSAWGATADYLMNNLQRGTVVDVIGDCKLRTYYSEEDKKSHLDARVTAFDVKIRARRKGLTVDSTGNDNVVEEAAS